MLPVDEDLSALSGGGGVSAVRRGADLVEPFARGAVRVVGRFRAVGKIGAASRFSGALAAAHPVYVIERFARRIGIRLLLSGPSDGGVENEVVRVVAEAPFLAVGVEVERHIEHIVRIEPQVVVFPLGGVGMVAVVEILVILEAEVDALLHVAAFLRRPVERAEELGVKLAVLAASDELHNVYFALIGPVADYSHRPERRPDPRSRGETRAHLHLAVGDSVESARIHIRAGLRDAVEAVAGGADDEVAVFGPKVFLPVEEVDRLGVRTELSVVDAPDAPVDLLAVEVVAEGLHPLVLGDLEDRPDAVLAVLAGQGPAALADDRELARTGGQQVEILRRTVHIDVRREGLAMLVEPDMIGVGFVYDVVFAVFGPVELPLLRVVAGALLEREVLPLVGVDQRLLPAQVGLFYARDEREGASGRYVDYLIEPVVAELGSGVLRVRRAGVLLRALAEEAERRYAHLGILLRIERDDDAFGAAYRGREQIVGQPELAALDGQRDILEVGNAGIRADAYRQRRFAASAVVFDVEGDSVAGGGLAHREVGGLPAAGAHRHYLGQHAVRLLGLYRTQTRNGAAQRLRRRGYALTAAGRLRLLRLRYAAAQILSALSGYSGAEQRFLCRKSFHRSNSRMLS